MSNSVATGENRSKVKDKQINALQLLFLLIPRQNAIVLECLLYLLHKVSDVSENLMTSHSLGMVFAPSLICPKKLSPLEFHSMSELFTKAVSFMIENKPFLFKIPRELAVDVVHFWQEMDETHNHYIFTEKSVPKQTNVHRNIQKAKIDNPAVQCAELKTFAQIPQTPKEKNATNAIWQDKGLVAIKCIENNCKKDSDSDLSMEFISGQKEEYYPFKVALRKKNLSNCTTETNSSNMSEYKIDYKATKIDTVEQKGITESLCLISIGNSFIAAGPWHAKECCLYDFVFIVGIMCIKLSEEEHNHPAGVYTWERLDRYAGLESVSET